MAKPSGVARGAVARRKRSEKDRKKHAGWRACPRCARSVSTNGRNFYHHMHKCDPAYFADKLAAFDARPAPPPSASAAAAAAARAQHHQLQLRPQPPPPHAQLRRAAAPHVHAHHQQHARGARGAPAPALSDAQNARFVQQLCFLRAYSPVADSAFRALEAAAGGRWGAFSAAAFADIRAAQARAHPLAPPPPPPPGPPALLAPAPALLLPRFARAPPVWAPPPAPAPRILTAASVPAPSPPHQPRPLPRAHAQPLPPPGPIPPPAPAPSPAAPPLPPRAPTPRAPAPRSPDKLMLFAQAALGVGVPRAANAPARYRPVLQPCASAPAVLQPLDVNRAATSGAPGGAAAAGKGRPGSAPRPGPRPASSSMSIFNVVNN